MLLQLYYLKDRNTNAFIAQYFKGYSHNNPAFTLRIGGHNCHAHAYILRGFMNMWKRQHAQSTER